MNILRLIPRDKLLTTITYIAYAGFGAYLLTIADKSNTMMNNGGVNLLLFLLLCMVWLGFLIIGITLRPQQGAVT